MRGKKNPNYKTGLRMKENAHMKGLYNSWVNMRRRCLTKTNPKYPRYGGRGIKICDEWSTIQGFYDWAIKAGWQPDLSLDRIDNDGDYCPENCQWISMAHNSSKKSTTKLTFEQAEEIRIRIDNGEDEYALADEYGVVHGTVWFIKNNITHKQPF